MLMEPFGCGKGTELLLFSSTSNLQKKAFEEKRKKINFTTAKKVKLFFKAGRGEKTVLFPNNLFPMGFLWKEKKQGTSPKKTTLNFFKP